MTTKYLSEMGKLKGSQTVIATAASHAHRVAINMNAPIEVVLSVETITNTLEVEVLQGKHPMTVLSIGIYFAYLFAGKEISMDKILQQTEMTKVTIEKNLAWTMQTMNMFRDQPNHHHRSDKHCLPCLRRLIPTTLANDDQLLKYAVFLPHH